MKRRYCLLPDRGISPLYTLRKAQITAGVSMKRSQTKNRRGGFEFYQKLLHRSFCLLATCTVAISARSNFGGSLKFLDTLLSVYNEGRKGFVVGDPVCRCMKIFVQCRSPEICNDYKHDRYIFLWMRRIVRWKLRFNNLWIVEYSDMNSQVEDLYLWKGLKLTKHLT